MRGKVGTCPGCGETIQTDNNFRVDTKGHIRRNGICFKCKRGGVNIQEEGRSIETKSILGGCECKPTREIIEKCRKEGREAPSLSQYKGEKILKVDASKLPGELTITTQCNNCGAMKEETFKYKYWDQAVSHTILPIVEEVDGALIKNERVEPLKYGKDDMEYRIRIPTSKQDEKKIEEWLFKVLNEVEDDGFLGVWNDFSLHLSYYKTFFPNEYSNYGVGRSVFVVEGGDMGTCEFPYEVVEIEEIFEGRQLKEMLEWQMNIDKIIQKDIAEGKRYYQEEMEENSGSRFGDNDLAHLLEERWKKLEEKK